MPRQSSLMHLATVVASPVWAPASNVKVLSVHKPANTTSFSAQWQGSVDQLDWTSIGTAQTASGAITDSFPWPYVRVNQTAVTSPAKTMTQVTHTAGVTNYNLTAHGFVTGDHVVVAGAVQAAYNWGGEVMRVTRVDANNFTLGSVPTATTTPATGTITVTPYLTYVVSETL